MSKRLYIIGIDSAPLWIIRRLYKKYKMNGFKMLMEKGLLKDMESTLPPLTPVAWPSIYTGLHPSKHGVMDFFKVEKDYSKKLLFYEVDKTDPFWETLSDKGLRSLLITPAVVCEVSKKPGVEMMTGWPLPPKYSSQRIEAAARRFDFSGEPNIEKKLEDGKISLKDAAKEYEDGIRKRSEMAQYLIKNNRYDLVYVCYTEIDRIQHYSLNRADWERYIAPLYKAVSDFIEWVAANEKGAAIMVLSDHGAQPITKKFMLNSWLINNGYETLKKGNYAPNRQETKIINSEAEDDPNLNYTFCVTDIMPGKNPGNGARRAVILEKNVRAAGDEPESFRLFDIDIDMEATHAFTSISNGSVGMIWINDGRFSNPTLNKKESDKVRKRLIKGLSNLKTEDNAKLVTKVYTGREYYGNTNLFVVPDLIFDLKESYIVDVKNYSHKKLFMDPEPAKYGDHIRNGIFGIIGDERAVKRLREKKMDVYDVKPTVLAYFDSKK
jgi:predicted AlkP superfamily phosphohydrolase/phosphomutase